MEKRMKVLFIGGNGNISWQCVQQALNLGYEVYEINRGATLNTRRKIQSGVYKIDCDVRDVTKMKMLLEGTAFDVVCDFICYNGEDAKRDVELFKDHTKQFIYISSEAIYERKGAKLPFTEKSKITLEEKAGDYVKGKIGGEKVFNSAYQKEGFPITIVRPGYTYDVIIPNPVGHNCFTASKKYLEGYPILIFGDGQNRWTFTHSEDFGKAFVGLFGKKKAIGETFQIMAQESYSWNEVADILFDSLKIKNKKVIHIPYEESLSINYFQSRDLVEQRLMDSLFDTTKVRKLVPEWNFNISLEEGIKRAYQWLFEDEVRRRINPIYEKNLEELYQKYS